MLRITSERGEYVLLLHHEAHEEHEELTSSWPSCASWLLLKFIDAAS